MSAIQKLHISFPIKEEEHDHQTTITPSELYRIDIQADEEWIVTGKYRDNNLCALELKRVSQIETKE